MAINAGKVFRTATAAARKFQHRQSSAAQTASPAVSSLLPATGGRCYQPYRHCYSGHVGIGETVKLLEGRKTGGDFSSPKSTNVRSIAKSIRKK